MAEITPLLAADKTPLFSQAAGIVSYTYHEEFKKDLPGTLYHLKRLGIVAREFSDLFGKKASVIRRQLASRGTSCSSFGVGNDYLMPARRVGASGTPRARIHFVTPLSDIQSRSLRSLAFDMSEALGEVENARFVAGAVLSSADNKNASGRKLDHPGLGSGGENRHQNPRSIRMAEFSASIGQIRG